MVFVEEEIIRLDWLNIVEKCKHEFNKYGKCEKCDLINAGLEKRLYKKEV